MARLQGAGVLVNSIWMADVAQQGTSGLLNEDKLGSDRKLSRPSMKVCIWDNTEWLSM